MSLKSEEIPPVPEETARVARAAFPDGSAIMRLRDALGTLYDDELFADLFPKRGQPAEARLSLSPGHGLPIHGRSFRSAGCTSGPPLY